MSDSLPPPRYTLWQSLAVAVSLATRAIEEVRALKGAPAPAAKFPAVGAWSEGVHYEGSVVAHNGATWQATKDTAREPPHDDWAILAAQGAPGPAPYVGEVCGLWEPGRSYRKLDYVTFNNSEWRARIDNPGPLPGNGWVMSAKRGSRGEQGERGERGPAGPAIVSWEKRDFRVVPVLSDGSVGPPLDLTEFFAMYDAERR